MQCQRTEAQLTEIFRVLDLASVAPEEGRPLIMQSEATLLPLAAFAVSHGKTNVNEVVFEKLHYLCCLS